METPRLISVSEVLIDTSAALTNNASEVSTDASVFLISASGVSALANFANAFFINASCVPALVNVSSVCFE